ncbi:hypothetical protein [Aurantiacibacter spongiae]|uniref:DUF4129 domain-containing protein n=1 Tax=Aurantiacibacter spongiae TaxID=2488860 RepID=A0A3N5CRZ2_9SPHN|nr:hypothetical protein [Aurantiacibacter spongiae]RPF71874.1 hypothetical protein EG799_09765 [Aurantiacibacter spongiae]
MTREQGNGAAVAGGDDFARAWRHMRADDSLQFAPVDMPAAPEPPDWLVRLQDWLAEVFAPLARFLAGIWPVLSWVLLALAIAAALFIVWRLFGPDLGARRARPEQMEDWAPEEGVALALLEEADRLAREGRFDEATHLLLQRSVGQIAEARPHLVEPSSTAREIAAEPRLPAAARNAFAIIAGRVERSLFALTRLTAEDWHAARAAYADFALANGRASA